MDWLTELLKDSVSEDKLEAVIEKFKTESPKHVIPKSVFNEKSDELKTIKTQLDEQKKLAEQLTQKANTVEEYETKVKDWQTKYNELEQNTQKQVSEITKRTSYKELLMTNNVHKDAIDLLLDAAKLEDVLVADGKITNGDDLIAKLKEQRAGLFITETQDSKDKNNQGQHINTKPTSEMSASEYAEYYSKREESRKTF